MKTEALADIKMSPAQVTQLLNHVFDFNATADPEDQFVVIIKGPPGIGKTAVIKAAAKEKLAGRIYKSHPSVEDPTDTKGIPWPSLDKESATFLPLGVLADILKEKEPALWFPDDFGQAPQAVQVTYMQWLHGKELNGKKLGQNINIVLATNRTEDLAAVFPIPEPVKSRMIIIELEFKLDEWVLWALKNGQPYEIIAFARFRPDIFDKFKPTKDMVNQVTPRTLARAGTLINSKLPKELQLATFAGTIGQAAAVELCGFLNTIANLPDPDQILLSPDTAPIPEEISAKHALVTALNRVVGKGTLEAAFKYIARWGDKSFDFMFAKDLYARPELLKTSAFVNFSVENHDINA